jgi:ubiquinone/menaquinone biosynthesis C-methylase UbiE
MAEVNLLERYPTSKRDASRRNLSKTEEVIRISRQFGLEYFDGTREHGYGGYDYDGRWLPIAEDIIAHWNLRPGMRVLDVGCAKGFLVKDFMRSCPGLEAFGVDISLYAIMHAAPEIVGRLHLGNAMSLPFPDESFDAIISINTLHNLRRPDCIRALKEIQRVARSGKAYVQVDSYRSPQEREVFLEWALTPYTHDYPEGWLRIFAEAGFTGDYYWTYVTG